ncbi:hypothetical protein [Pseudomonas fluorescens]|uniref:Uncharacterized protein n=1 Tax=Pseudomonas fluorescens TaxID=294 RepID=A0A5E7H568_PSEFL|nr:hypothetical protein [Pseudomonas fluorescens]VVO59114.1 hypothetical protein PS880_00705 [Pseudomonas fluorescens]
MAKPPKRVIVSEALDLSTHKRTSPDTDPVRGEHSGIFGRSAQDMQQVPGSSASTASPAIPPHQPIVVSKMPVSGADAVKIDSNLNTWPRDQIDQLIRIEDTGLFMSAEQKLYADAGEEGILRIEANAKGEYQAPPLIASDKPGPILVKIPDEPRWRIERRGLDTSGTGKTVSVQSSDALAKQTLEIIPPTFAEKLTKADSNGLRYDKLKRTYADVAEEGTVLVRKNAEGEYQASNASELTPSGPVLESIEGMTLWQRKPQLAESPLQRPSTEDSGPGPSKRPRLDDGIEPGETEAGIVPVTVTTTPNSYLWASWGKITKPDASESIQIGQLHYPIVPRGPLADKLPLAFIQHPQFAPSRFEAFERMLHEAPELQPVPVYRSSQGQQKVSGAGRVFKKTLTQYVVDTFKGFTDQTSRVVAKRLFELSSGSEEMNGSGLARMMQTFRNWQGNSMKGVPGIGDPLDMLPATATLGGSRRVVSLLTPESVKTLQQLNLNPSNHWKIYADDPTAINLKTLFINILNDSGYDTLTPEAVTHHNTLVFKRPNHPKVYFMKLGRTVDDDIEIRTPLTPELEDPLLIKQMSANTHQTLVAANARNDVVWLIGGIQHPPGRSPSLFIIRDR